MLITTLPIAYVAGRPVRILSSSIVSSILSNATGAKVCFPLNAISARSSNEKSLGQKLADFHHCLGALGLLSDRSAVLADGSDEVLQNSRKLLDRTSLSGLCFPQETLIAHCGCGKVEIPTSILEEARCDTNQSMHSRASGVPACRICGSKLENSQARGLFYRQGRVELPLVLPTNHEGRLLGILNDLAGKSFYISRSFRSIPEGLSLDDCGYLDPDFHSALYLVHLWNLHRENLVLVIGMNHFYRACWAYAVAKSFAPESSISIVAHPMFSSENDLMSLPVEDAISRMGSKTALKLLFGTMLRWTRYDSLCSAKDIERIVSLEDLHCQGDMQSMPFDRTILTKVNGNAYASLLSRLRKAQGLGDHDRVLYLSVR